MPPLDLTLIPFIFRDDADSSMVSLVRDIAADSEHHEMLEYARLLLPLKDLDVTAHEPVLTMAEDVIELAARDRDHPSHGRAERALHGHDAAGVRRA